MSTILTSKQRATDSDCFRRPNPNKRARDEIRAVYLTSWLVDNAQPTSSDFSFGRRGHLIESGTIGRPIRAMNVADNLSPL